MFASDLFKTTALPLQECLSQFKKDTWVSALYVIFQRTQKQYAAWAVITLGCMHHFLGQK